MPIAYPPTDADGHDSAWLRRVALGSSCLSGVAALIGLLAWLVRGETAMLAMTAVAALNALWLLFTRRTARRGQELRTVALMAAGTYVTLLLLLPIKPESSIIMAIVAVAPVFVALPYLTPRQVTRYAAAAWLMSTGISLAAILVRESAGGPARDVPQLMADLVGPMIVVAVFLLLLHQIHGTNQNVRRLALRDGLTGLYNRTLFVDRLEHALAREQRVPSSTAVVYFDLDGFKDVNDRHGHGYGDAVLCAMAERMKTITRAADTLARMGGDEFALLMEGVTDSADAVAVARRIVDTTQTPVVHAEMSVHLSMSAGVAVSGVAGETAEVLMRNADFAMYEAKRLRDRSVVVYHPSMRLRDAAGRRDRQALRGITARDELTLRFQPIVRLHSGYRDIPVSDAPAGTIAAFEALVRWEDPDRGTRMPGDFIQLAEETGEIVPLGRWVLREACRQLAEWRQLPGGRDLQISVNVSALQLEDPTFERDVADALADSGIPPTALVLELTERVLGRDLTRVGSVLHWLRAARVQIAIDDFGTGSSSLSHLRHLPIDVLKLDRSLLDGAVGDAQSEAILLSLVQIGAALRTLVVAEGIEDVRQVRTLRSLGCDLGQGYVLAQPLDAVAAREFVTAAHRPWDRLFGRAPATESRARPPILSAASSSSGS